MLIMWQKFFFLFFVGKDEKGDDGGGGCFFWVRNEKRKNLSFHCDRMYVFGVICHPSSVFYIIVGEFLSFFLIKINHKCQTVARIKCGKNIHLYYTYISLRTTDYIRRFFCFVVVDVRKVKAFNNIKQI